MRYLEIMLLAMLPLIELRGAIPIGIAMDLNPIAVYVASVIGSTIVSIPLILTFRHILNFFRSVDMFLPLVKKVDSKNRNWNEKIKEHIYIRYYTFCGDTSSYYGDLDSSSYSINT